MRWLKKIKHHAFRCRPILKAYNPRIGTSIIPLDRGDKEIFFQFLCNKVQSLYFEGSSTQLTNMIYGLQNDQGFTIRRMRISLGRGSEKVMLLHLKMSDEQELRRVIKLV